MATPEQRDAGLRRLSRVTRWLTGGAILATGGLSFLAARASATKATTLPTNPSVPTEAPTPAGDGGQVTDLSPPAQPPTQSSDRPVVTSGAS